MTNKIPVVWHPAYDVLNNVPWYLRVAAKLMAATPVSKYAVIKAQLPSDTYEVEAGRYITHEELLRVHTEAYVRQVVALASKGTLRATADVVRGRTPITSDSVPYGPEVLEFFMAACGGTVEAVNAALGTGVAFNLSGGFHHARAEAGAGFCLFNDVALAAKASGKRTLIVDVDVHQGDGTAQILAGDASCHTLSFHQAEGYPQPRFESTVDIELDVGAEDKQYLPAFSKYLKESWDQHDPELIIYVAGVDVLDTDKLGGLLLSLDGVKERDRRLFRMAKRRNVPVAVVLAGGYSDTATTAAAHLGTFEAAASVFGHHP